MRKIRFCAAEEGMEFFDADVKSVFFCAVIGVRLQKVQQYRSKIYRQANTTAENGSCENICRVVQAKEYSRESDRDGDQHKGNRQHWHRQGKA